MPISEPSTRMRMPFFHTCSDAPEQGLTHDVHHNTPTIYGLGNQAITALFAMACAQQHEPMPSLGRMKRIRQDSCHVTAAQKVGSI